MQALTVYIASTAGWNPKYSRLLVSLVFAFIPLSASSSDRLFAFIPLSASSSYRHFFDSRIGDFSKNVIISESQISFRCGILTYMDGMMEDGISRVTIATCGRYTVYIRGRPHLLRDSVRMGPWGRVFWTFGDRVWSHFQKIRRSQTKTVDLSFLCHSVTHTMLKVRDFYSRLSVPDLSHTP